MTTPWREKASALADRLAGNGELSNGWRAAFEQVPRHVFLPQHSLEVAYTDDAVVTQHKTAVIDGSSTVELPTSSASAPGVVAVMLDRLNVTAGMRVLEIGTGTGYNAALLSFQLGDTNVYSVELDPALTAAAGGALTEVGYAPHLLAGDGAVGYPGVAPFDRIIATCAVDHIPPEWIRQLTDGGRIVAPLMGGADSALLVLDKTAPDEVTGRLDPYRVSFMPLRDEINNPLPSRSPWGRVAGQMPAYGTTGMDPAIIREGDPDLLLWLHLHIPGLRIGGLEAPGRSAVSLSRPGAIADVELEPSRPGLWPVQQRGQARLWDTAEIAVALWEDLGKPGRHRLGVTALDDVDRQYVWLDDPSGPYSWPMPV
jgi:protein-L-isoaspartate(D-aspartate) O-methyltransferase